MEGMLRPCVFPPLPTSKPLVDRMPDHRIAVFCRSSQVTPSTQVWGCTGCSTAGVALRRRQRQQGCPPSRKANMLKASGVRCDLFLA